MWIRQVFVVSLCILLASQQTNAVVNTASSSKAAVESTSTSSSSNGETSESDSINVADSESSGSEQEANRREAPLGLGDTFGTPLALDGIYGLPVDSYVPETPSNLGLPIPIYGVPNIGSNLLYPAPPPDIPPPISSVGLTYGVPTALNFPLKNNFVPPKLSYGPPKIYGPPKLPTTKYGPPFLQRPPRPFNPPQFQGHKSSKPFYGPPRFQPNFNIKNIHKVPKHFYGPPKPQYGPPKSQYGPPKPQYGPPKLAYGPPKQLNVLPKPIYGPPADGILNPPPLVDTYGPPNINLNVINDVGKQQISVQYGPPEPIPHGPPHPGAPAPPTPPDIKYDGWQPIPGLVSRPPSDLYGAPHGQQHVGSVDIQISGDFIPPPIAGAGVHSLGLQDSYKSSAALSDSYGAPLNTVTGSGGIDSTSGEAHQHHNQHQGALNLGLSATGIGGQDNSLSVVKSVGYELFPNSGGVRFATGHLDTYSSPPANSYSPDGPYAAAHSYNTNGVSQANLFGSSFTSSFGSAGRNVLPSNGVGLIPPSGLYGVTPSSLYGTPLFQPNINNNLNALEINPPKRPVVFREPVPHGLIEAIGNAVAQKDAQGIIESSHANLGGSTYIPPPIPDLAKPVREPEPPHPSTLYSLPNVNNPISFQNVVHGSSTSGLHTEFSNNFNGYSNSLGSVDGAYALPLKSPQISFNVDQAHSVDQNQGPAFDISQSHGGIFNADQSHGQAFNIDQSYSNAFSHNYGIDQSQGHTFSQNVGVDQSQDHAFSNNGFSTFNLGQTHSNVGLDYNSLTGANTVQNLGAFQNLQHDCSLHKSHSQPLPQLSYGVPSANTYTEALTSLKTNIGGSFQGQLPQSTYGTPDLQAAHSQSVSVSSGSSANAISESSSKENYGKSLGESFAAGGELIKSQSLDLNSIPLQGALGSYTLQIQSADGLGSQGASSHVPHDQVLNDGLLQSILAAIEQPQKQNANILGQPLLQVQPYIQITNAPVVQEQSTSEVENRADGETQESEKNAVVVSPLVTETQAAQNTNTTEAQASADKDAIQLLDNNEIALYFSNNSEPERSKGGGGDSGQQDDLSKIDNVRDGQQQGSYVSFKTPNTSYVYGDLKSSQTEKTSDTEEQVRL